MAILSFGKRNDQLFFETGRIPKRAGWKAVAKIVKRKLDILDYAEEIRDLRSPPGNRLEQLKGNWKGYYSMRINDQWRIVFQWDDGAIDVTVIDYH